MTDPNQPAQTESRTAGIGTFVFVALCGLPALEMSGFGFGIPFTVPTAVLSTPWSWC
jgi:hypothetical protein